MSIPFPFDITVLIGRFQPFHLGHAALLAKALESAPEVAVILGSSLRARTAKNPFTWTERAAMISATLEPETRSRLHFIPMRDYYDNTLWAKAVASSVHSACKGGARIALVGHRKDFSSDYLDLFPDWTLVAAGQQGDFNATELRRSYFEGEASGIAQLMDSVPAKLRGYLEEWATCPDYERMREEHWALEEGKKVWGHGPFITVDAVVRSVEQVLLVRRGRCPGKGLWAIPGGFLEREERLLEGALRELREETLLDLQDPLLDCELREVAVFDHPDRSQRGRTITHAHHFNLDCPVLPEVAGSDDAAEARWMPITDLPAMEDQLFEDHFHILDHFLAII